ncbi:MAG TPA: hypothetical protein VK766_02450 [Cytophagaceae bacterium]|jgi:hypothetical protein|nr:hypothetical protein [Cytophagaceae bacterium]
MVQQHTTIEWAYEHYFVYLHLCIADSDCVICDHEFEKIQKAAFPNIDAERGKQLIKDVYLEFLAHNDYEKKMVIKELAPKYLRTSSIRTRVLQNLQCLVNKDEESEEQIMFRYIEKAIQYNK